MKMKAIWALVLILSAAAPLWAADDAPAGFRAFCEEKAAAGDSMAVAGKDGWLFLRSELRHVGAGPFWGESAAKVSKATSPDRADPLAAIVDFNEQLKTMGIELILVPVPCKALMYPEALGQPSDARLDSVHQQFYKVLGDKGVKVLDLAGIFWQAKAQKESAPLYCKTDSHWSPRACELTAGAVRKMLGEPAWLKGNSGAFKARTETRTIQGDLAGGQGSEQLTARVVEQAGATEDKSSPVVLLGDSHTLVFHVGGDMHGTGAGLADQLAVELGCGVDVVGVRGSGATPARVNLLRRSRADAAYLGGKKVIIWCFAAREFTESPGWTVFKLAR